MQSPIRLRCSRLALTVFVGCLLVVGCRHGADADASATEATPAATSEPAAPTVQPRQPGDIVFGVFYYPYDSSMLRVIGKPYPNYQGWTDARMDRDILAIAQAGINRIYLNVSPKALNDAVRHERYLAFVERVSALGGVLQVVFLSDCKDMRYRDFERFLNRCADFGLHGREGYYKVHGKPIVLVQQADDFRLISHPAVTVRHSKWDRPEIAEADRSLRLARSNVAADEIIINAGRAVGGRYGLDVKWQLKRREGKTLRDAVRAAREQRPKVIIMNSWNNYLDGSFIEPNTLDGRAVIEMLTQELLPPPLPAK
jgi:hypothetical protein